MKKLFLVLALLVLSVSVVKACQPTVEPSPTPTATPTASPTATPEPTVPPCWTNESLDLKVDIPNWDNIPCPTPTETPAPTEQPKVENFTLGGPAYAPTQPSCLTMEQWLPQIVYKGRTQNNNGTYTFHYTIKSVTEKNPTWFVWYGFVPTSLPYVYIAHGETVDITQSGSTNWIKASLYSEPGCFSPWSQIIN